MRRVHDASGQYTVNSEYCIIFRCGLSRDQQLF